MQINKSDIDKARGIFDAYNVNRIFIATDEFSRVENEMISAIPLLLHSNFKIPGLVCQKNTPCKISFFNPHESNYDASKNLFPGVKWLNEEEDREPEIHSLALIGSIGSVAQTKKSDFDYVVFVEKSRLEKEPLEDFQKKLTSIENWALINLDVEVHFFIQDIEDFRENRFGLTDKDTVGSAAGRLFKDEFYRTAIFVAGKRPLWWIIPPGLPEEKAEEFKHALRSFIGKAENDYMDLGHLIKIHPHEFIGGALWQMNKLLNYPFKSLLKMGLLEFYLFSENSVLLCESLKRTLIESTVDIQDMQIDPYIMMCDQITSYYNKRGMEKEVYILRGAFLLKTGLKIEQIDDFLKRPTEKMHDKERKISDLMKKWNWSKKDTTILKENLLDQPKKYQSTDIISKFILDIYIRLSDWLRNSKITDSLITEKDLTVLGRRLFTYFERKPNKVPFIPSGNMPDKPPKFMSIVYEQKNAEENVWSFYDENIARIRSEKYKKSIPHITRSDSLMFVLTWIVINRFWEPGSYLHFEAGSSRFRTKDMKQILRELYEFFMEDSSCEPDREDYLSNNRIVKALIFLNYGIQRPSRSIKKIDMVLLNSWGEYKSRMSSNITGYKELANMILVSEKENKHFYFKILAPSLQDATTLCEDFENSAYEVKKLLVTPEANVRKKVKLDLF